jgi:hypothetical protein
LDPSAALLLTFEVNRTIARRKDQKWHAEVDHVDMPPSGVEHVRNALAEFALQAIVGPSASSVAIDRQLLGSRNAEWPALIVNPANCDVMCHIYDYFRVACALSVEPRRAQHAADTIDLSLLSEHWRTPIAVELVFPERTAGGVRVLEQESITLDLRLGINLMRLRKAIGDWRLGGFSVAPFSHFGQGEHHLPQTRLDGTKGSTLLTDQKSGRTVSVSLNLHEVHLPSDPEIRKSLRLPANEAPDRHS